MNEMVERVARALQSATGNTYMTWDELPDASKDRRRMYARVAIEAMREPTQDMLTAMGAVPELPIAGYFAKTYYAAIDEALK